LKDVDGQVVARLQEEHLELRARLAPLERRMEWQTEYLREALEILGEWVEL
jgi:hypothetical protein